MSECICDLYCRGRCGCRVCDPRDEALAAARAALVAAKHTEEDA